MTEGRLLHPSPLSLKLHRLALWMSAARLLDDDTTRHRWVSGILHRHVVNLHSATDQSSHVFDQIDILYKLMLRILLNSTIICMTVISYLSTENLTFVEFKIASTTKSTPFFFAIQRRRYGSKRFTLSFKAHETYILLSAHARDNA